MNCQLIEGPEGCNLHQKSIPSGGASVVINLFNDTSKEIRIYWIDPRGEYHDYGSRLPFEEFEILTTNNQLYLITEMDGSCLGTIVSRPNLQANVSAYITPNNRLSNNNNNNNNSMNEEENIMKENYKGMDKVYWFKVVVLICVFLLIVNYS